MTWLGNYEEITCPIVAMHLLVTFYCPVPAHVEPLWAVKVMPQQGVRGCQTWDSRPTAKDVTFCGLIINDITSRAICHILIILPHWVIWKVKEWTTYRYEIRIIQPNENADCPICKSRRKCITLHQVFASSLYPNHPKTPVLACLRSRSLHFPCSVH